MQGLERWNIWLDLDGVMADFDRGFLENCGSTIPMREYLDKEQAWDLIKRTPDFWKRLLPMPGAISFWEYLLPFRPCILTSPSSHDTDRAILQKREWVDFWLGKSTPVFYRRAKNKCQLASPDAILIDDWEPNIRSWSEAGGHAVHHVNVETSKQRLEQIAEIKDIHGYIRR